VKRRIAELLNLRNLSRQNLPLPSTRKTRSNYNGNLPYFCTNRERRVTAKDYNQKRERERERVEKLFQVFVFVFFPTSFNLLLGRHSSVSSGRCSSPSSSVEVSESSVVFDTERTSCGKKSSTRQSKPECETEEKIRELTSVRVTRELGDSSLGFFSSCELHNSCSFRSTVFVDNFCLFDSSSSLEQLDQILV